MGSLADIFKIARRDKLKDNSLAAQTRRLERRK